MVGSGGKIPGFNLKRFVLKNVAVFNNLAVSQLFYYSFPGDIELANGGALRQFGALAVSLFAFLFTNGRVMALPVI